MNEQIASRPQRVTFSMAISSEKFQKVINNTIRDPQRAQRFVTAITSAVAVNPQLQDCEPASILSAALLGESLNLAPSPQLGQYYLVPYRNRKLNIKQAQFQLGYRGYIQLALRSGYYKSLNVLAIKKGELKKWNPLTEELVVNLIEDDTTREMTETAGYVATFTYLNGFTKTLYWTKEKMEAHAKRYVPGYKAMDGSSKWQEDFEAMAYKTMLRQLISKWGVMSSEMQTAIEGDVEGEEYVSMEEPAQLAPVETPALPEEVPEQEADIDATMAPEPELKESPPKQKTVKNTKKAQQMIEEELSLDEL